MFLNDTDTLALIYFSLLLYLQTREAAGITVMVYYAAVQGKKKKKKKRGCIFSSSLPYKLQLHLLMTF